MTVPSEGDGRPSDSEPDVPLSLGVDTAPRQASPAPPPEADLIDQLVRTLLADAPADWAAMAATFSLTVDQQTGLLVFVSADGEQQQQRLPSPEAFSLVREQRERAATEARGPWWRMTVSQEPTGQSQVDFDYGEEPFAADFLFEPEAYRADFAAYPDRDIPLWLSAYALHENRQRRSPKAAAQGASGSAVALVADGHWPRLESMWARWSAIAAVFGSMEPGGFGASVAPGLAIFESTSRSGSTLVRLPGGRAVLSGGVVDSPELKAAYTDGGELPDLYAGAPMWVSDATLNARAHVGMLSFCWWYEDGHWYRSGSPDAKDCAAAVPHVGTTGDTARVLCDVLGVEPTDDQFAVATAYVGAAESGTVTRTVVESLLPPAQGYDTDSALMALAIAGCFTGRS